MPQRKKFEQLDRAIIVAMAAGLGLFNTPALAQSCPPQGDATQPLARELNPFKNREDGPPVASINRNATLAAVLAPGPDLQRWSRTDGAIFEGVVINVKEGGIESVNCHARDPAHRDTHIELALSAGAPPNQRVIVEVTPHWRQAMAIIADWSTSALKRQLIGHRVRVTGWLFDDLEHRPQAENTNPGNARNWRATVWEIHPITAIQLLPGPAVRSVAGALPRHAVAQPRSKAKRRCQRSRRGKCQPRRPR